MADIIEINVSTGERTEHQMTKQEVDALPPRSPLHELESLKINRAEKVRMITITTAAGNTFDGNEEAQNRMARAVIGMNDGDTMAWTLADDSEVVVTKQELREALRLAGTAQTELWRIPYQ